MDSFTEIDLLIIYLFGFIGMLTVATVVFAVAYLLFSSLVA